MINNRENYKSNTRMRTSSRMRTNTVKSQTILLSIPPKDSKIFIFQTTPNCATLHTPPTSRRKSRGSIQTTKELKEQPNIKKTTQIPISRVKRSYLSTICSLTNSLQAGFLLCGCSSLNDLTKILLWGLNNSTVVLPNMITKYLYARQLKKLYNSSEPKTLILRSWLIWTMLRNLSVDPNYKPKYCQFICTTTIPKTVSLVQYPSKPYQRKSEGCTPIWVHYWNVQRQTLRTGTGLWNKRTKSMK